MDNNFHDFAKSLFASIRNNPTILTNLIEEGKLSDSNMIMQGDPPIILLQLPEIRCLYKATSSENKLPPFSS